MRRNLGNASNLYSYLHMINVSSKTANTPQSSAEAKMASKKIHKEAEQRRRNRLGAHYETLRSILPKTVKHGKASVLAEAIRQVTELKKKATDLAELNSCWTDNSAFPGDTDEVKTAQCDGDSGMVKVTLCCEDRKELISDLMNALKLIKGKLVRAEMGTIGGRTKCILWVQVPPGGEGVSVDGGDVRVVREELLGTVRRVLKGVIDRPVVSRLGQGSKRTTTCNFY